jgi:hypothetical protein
VFSKPKNNAMKQLLTLLIVLVSAFAQAQTDSTQEANPRLYRPMGPLLLKGAYGYSLAGQKIPRAEALQLLKTNTAAYGVYLKGKNRTASGSLLITAGALAASVGYVQSNANTLVVSPTGVSYAQSGLYFFGGLAAVGAGVGVLISGIRNKKKAFKVYNQTYNARPQFGFHAGANHAGVVLRF